MTQANPSGSFFFDYWRDACERSVLFLDILRQRGNDNFIQSARTAPHVLNFEAEVLRRWAHAAESRSITRWSESFRQPT